MSDLVCVLWRCSLHVSDNSERCNPTHHTNKRLLATPCMWLKSDFLQQICVTRCDFYVNHGYLNTFAQAVRTYRWPCVLYYVHGPITFLGRPSYKLREKSAFHKQQSCVNTWYFSNTMKIKLRTTYPIKQILNLFFHFEFDKELSFLSICVVLFIMETIPLCYWINYTYPVEHNTS